jgi:hypothetical protein
MEFGLARLLHETLRLGEGSASSGTNFTGEFVMSTEYDEGRSEHPDDDESGADETHARLLFESGDMGVRPGRRYPVCLGDSERAQRWRAVMGLCEEENLRCLEQQAQRDNPDRYIVKLRRRPRSTTFSPNDRLIGANQYREAYNAVAYANSLGAILNTHITLTWSLLGYEDDNEASAALQGGLIKHMREWHRHKEDPLSRPLAWLYAHERSPSAGFHTHFLVSIPDEWRPDFDGWLHGRVKRLARLRDAPENAVYVSDARPDRPFMHQWRQFGYLMKTVDPRASLPVFPGSATNVPLPDLVPYAYESPGEVKCKLRIGIAQEIHATARARANYRSLLDCGVTDVRLLHGDYDYKGWEWAQRATHAAAEIAASAELEEISWAELSMMSAESERAGADEEFRQRYEAWHQTAKTFDDYVRESEKIRAAQLSAIATLFGGTGTGETWQRPEW